MEYFASLPNVAVLVFDNRGSGNSTSPRGLYTSRAMAGDAVVLLDAVGWSDPRSLVIVGASLGGMIAMDLVRDFKPASRMLLMPCTGSPRARSNIDPRSGVDKIGVQIQLAYASNGMAHGSVPLRHCLDAAARSWPHPRDNVPSDVYEPRDPEWPEDRKSVV